LQGDDGAAEDANEQDNDEASYADHIHLNEDVGVVVRLAENVEKSLAGQEEEVLKRLKARLQETKQAGAPGKNFAFMAQGYHSEARKGGELSTF
jgi:hypothetical protein